MFCSKRRRLDTNPDDTNPSMSNYEKILLNDKLRLLGTFENTEDEIGELSL